MRIAITKDLLSGALFIVAGAIAAYVASGYKMGTLTRMGPGLFPSLISLLVVLVGVALVLRSMLSPLSSGPVASWEVRPLVFVLLAIIAFGLTISTLGLIPAIAAVVLICQPASREASFIEVLLIIAVLCVVTIGTFVYGLNIPLKIGPW